MAIRKACNSAVSVLNTGKECDTSMGATALLIAVHPSLRFTLADIEDDYTDWLTDLIHDRIAFPLFGIEAPIRTIQNSTESDVQVTLDDGLIVFLRYGIYNRTFETTSGGLCYAKALASFKGSGYRLIEIDQTGQMLVRKQPKVEGQDQEYSGMIIDQMYSPSPILADFKSTPYKNRFQYSFGPQEMVTNGVIFQGASELLSFTGLIDAEITKEAAGSITELTVGVKTECAETDLVALLTTAWLFVNNFIVTNKATGVVVTPTGVTNVGGNLVLTGTYVSGQTYTVKGNTPATWLTHDIEGYDGSVNGVDILIP